MSLTSAIEYMGSEQQAEVVTHHHPRMNHPTVAFTNLPEMMKKDLAVIVGHKHHIPPLPRAITLIPP
jgi:hypothetical protein